MNQLHEISAHFNATLAAACIRFCNNPLPADERVRVREHHRLSEAVVWEVLLRLDGVDAQGDEKVRARRREMVVYALSVLKHLDAKLGGPDGGEVGVDDDDNEYDTRTNGKGDKKTVMTLGAGRSR